MAQESELSGRQEVAAGLVADDQLSDEAIAKRLGIGRNTLVRWRRLQIFQDRVEAIRTAVAAQVVSEGIAVRTKRVAALNDRWNRMQRVISERADDTAMVGVAGGETGLLVHTYKMVGSGRDATTVDEYAVDVGLLKELRAHEEQAAKELGQWTEKQEHTGEVLVRRYIGIDLDSV